MPVATEHQEQSLLFQWAALAKAHTPELGLLFAIPNAGGYKGGFRSNVVQAVRAKREGVRPGVPDVMLPVPRAGYHGLFVEMKRLKGSSTSAEQRAWLLALTEQGYRAVRCLGWERARDEITAYLEAV